MTGNLLVNEIYLSVQGESSFAGLPCIFVRLTGCDLRCSYCDTAYAFTGGKKQTIEEVRAAVHAVARDFVQRARGGKKSAAGASRGAELLLRPVGPSMATTPLIELTGGEPLLQKNCVPLLKSFCDDGFTVLLETSGAHDISQVDRRVHRIMDLKCPSSGETEQMRWENIGHLGLRDEIKFVIATVEDYDWARQVIRQYRLDSVCGLLMSWAHPLHEAQRSKELKTFPVNQAPISRRELAERIIADALPVRFQTQLHKLIWPPEMKGV
jgi:7-carboxy-7-deazaguanine synthase